MASAVNSVVVGVFKEKSRVGHVIDILRDVEFRDSQLTVVMYDESNLYQGLYEKLVQIGLTEEEARSYQHDFENGNSLVLVRHEGRLWEAVNILYGNRIHRYMNRLGHQHQEGSLDKQHPVSPINTLAEESSHEVVQQEKMPADTIPDWQRILTNANLIHLFDELL